MKLLKNILIAPDSFKDCLTAVEVARFIGEGIRQSFPDAGISVFPIADGGEGTTSCISFHRGGKWRELTVNDPLHRPVRAEYLLLEDESCAIIELARASGLELLSPKQRNALTTSTFGTGELIRDALDRGIGRIILTIGGSATVDGGIGIAAALGFRFIGKDGRTVQPSGGNLTEIAKIDTWNNYPLFGKRNTHALPTRPIGVHPGLMDTEIAIACDVQNILNGPKGAARVYGPQKGADKKAVKILEKGLSHLSALVMSSTGFDADKNPGTGAAGGAALFLMAYGKGVLHGGFDIVNELTGFSDAVASAGIVISGEGKIDTQTGYGKAVASVARITKVAKKPLILVGGIIEGDTKVLKDQYDAAGIFSLMELAADKDDSVRNAPKYLKLIGIRIAEQFIDW